MTALTAPTKRNVGFLLVLGILFFPFVFAWFLLRNGHSLFARIVGFGWLALCVLAAVASPSTTSTHKTITTQPSVSSVAPAAAPAETLKAYTAAQVAASYEENTVAADIAFKGRRVVVSGRITDINTDFMGNPYLVLAGTNQFMGPQFKFDKSDMSVMAALKKGASVKVICTGKGDVVKTPMFEDCEMSK